MSAAALKLEIRDRFQNVVRLHSPKRLALMADTSPRTVEKWRAGGLPSVPAFLLLAREIPELNAAVRRWLDLSMDGDPAAEPLALEIAKAALRAIERRADKLKNQEGT